MRELLYELRFPLLGVIVVSIVLGFILGRSRTEKPQADESRRPDYYVKLEKAGANPDHLSITVGQMVQFDSRDGNYHNIVEASDGDTSHTSHTSGGYSSGIFAPDEGYQATFLKPGAYVFHDHLHNHIVIYIDVHESTTTRK